jgi:tripartite-type tricarboxylate transporter receptor subunit TctC
VTTPNLYLAIEKNKALNIDSPFKLEQIQPIALTSADPLIFVVQAESPYKSIKEFVADAKAKEGQLAYSTSGPYGITHVPLAMFAHAAGIKMRHVPTTGGGPALTQLLGGHVQASGGGIATTSPFVKSGKMRALASWGAKRHPNMPDVPTFKEQGYDIEAYLWVGLFTTAGVPESTFKAMREMLRKTINDPMYKQAMQKANVEVDYRDTPEFVKFFREDHKRLGAVVHRIAAEEKK